MTSITYVGLDVHTTNYTAACYIRMRDDVNGALKRIKQQITAFCIRNGKIYRGVVGKNYWTHKHLNWLEKLEFNNPFFKRNS